jgi:hypothetical protein
MSVINNNAFISTNPTATRFIKTGSGRILKKSFSSFQSYHSKSFDEAAEKDFTNNNQGFRRATSTTCLNNLRYAHLKLLAAREA